MGRISRQWLCIVGALVVATMVSACGSKGSKGVVSSANPGIFNAHSVAFKNATTLMAWGYNGYGQVGDGTSDERHTPVQVLKENSVPLKGMTGFAIGGTHTLAFQNLGGVRAWGNNGNGQLGNGNNNAQALPVTVLTEESGNNELVGVTAVSAGSTHSLALKSDGTVWAWGNNSKGELGIGNTDSKNRAVQVKADANSPLTGVKAIAAGGSHSLALKSDGTVWVWGNNESGQLGKDPKAAQGAITSSTTPLQVTGITGTAVAIAAGGSHSLALMEDGSVWAWGYNYFGQLGAAKVLGNPTLDPNNPASYYRIEPAMITGLSSVSGITAGLDHSVALLADGTLVAWGYNGYGQLGNAATLNINVPDPTQNPVPQQVVKTAAAPHVPLGNIRSVVAVGHHTLAVDGDGNFWAWGNNKNGQLGDNTTDSRSFAAETK